MFQFRIRVQVQLHSFAHIRREPSCQFMSSGKALPLPDMDDLISNALFEIRHAIRLPESHDFQKSLTACHAA